MNISIDKKKIVQVTYERLNRVYNKQHVLNVISILFEEIIKDLLSGKKIVLKNFGEIEAVQTKPRRHMDVVSKQISVSKGSTILKFILNKKISRFLKKRIDIDKTFVETHSSEG